MRALRRFFNRIASWTTRRRDEERLRAEFEEHIALETAANLRAGMPAREARRQARLKFGGVEAIKERYREQRGLPSLEALVRDARYALRGLRLAPAFTSATILTLALGIGATTAVFTLANAVLLKSLPVSRPGELWRLGRETHCCFLAGYSQENEFSLVSYDLYRYLQDHTQGFAELAAFPSIQSLFGVRRSGSSEPAQSRFGEFVSGNYFSMFGIQPYAGRLLARDDDRPGAAPAAVMSHRLWQQHYGSDPSVIGAVFNLNDRPFTVVGITPPGFFGDTLRSAAPDFFLPLNTEPYVQSDSDLNKYDTHWLELIGRLQSGAAPAAIEAQMRVELRQWLLAHRDEMSPADRARLPRQTLFLSPGGAGITALRDQYRRWLQILMAVTGFVLLIVCANVANLMLVRAAERRRQTSLSLALGAPTLRVMRGPLLESLLLSLLGGAAGIAIASVGARLILKFAFPSLPGSGGVPIDASPSVAVLLFALAVSLTTGVAFGLAPAWLALRVDPIEALRGGSRSTARAGLLPRKTLVVFQAALSLALLSTAGLLVAALQNLENQRLGFDPERRLTASFDTRLAGYPPARLHEVYTRIHDSIARLPGVASAALCLYAPPGGGWASGVWIDGRPAPAPQDESFASWNRVTAGYFDAIGTPILSGRAISREDTAASRKVAVVSEAFARKFFPNSDPIGQHFGRRPETKGEFEVIGVAADARYWNRIPSQSTGPIYFLAEAQAEYSQANLGSLFLRSIVISIRPGAGLSEASIRLALASVDPDIPILSIRPMKEDVAAQYLQQRLLARLASFFGVLSLLLASIGLYGVTAYNAGSRAAEIGVRMALGAGRGQVVRLVLQSALRLTFAGLLVGLPLAFAAGRLLGSQLYGAGPFNPAVTLIAVLALGFSALFASFIPALRASRRSPVDALRAE